jgi:hypothetical protein
MADNYKVPASKIPKSKKLLLYPGDPLIGVLSPDSYVIVQKGSLEPYPEYPFGESDDEGSGDDEDNLDGGDDAVDEDPRQAPKLEDISLVSKTMVTDGNGNQFVEFKFNIKNSVGAEVVGVNGYGR